jgi:hypothetical protein
VAHVPPVLPAGVPQIYLPLIGPVRPAGAEEPVYQAGVLGFAEVVFVDKRRGLEYRRPYRLLAKPPAAGQAVAWHAAERVGGALAGAPEANGRWGDVPETLNSAKKIKALEKGFAGYLYGNAKLTLLENTKLGLISTPGEDVLAFQQRCRAAAQQEAAQALAAERAKYQAKFEALGVAMPADQPEPEPAESSFLGWFNPFRLLGLGGSSERPPARGPGKGTRQEEAARKLAAEWNAKQAAVIDKWKQVGEDYAEFQLTPRRADVQITHFGLVWAPYWQVHLGNGQARMVPAYQTG